MYIIEVCKNWFVLNCALKSTTTIITIQSTFMNIIKIRDIFVLRSTMKYHLYLLLSYSIYLDIKTFLSFINFFVTTDSLY